MRSGSDTAWRGKSVKTVVSVPALVPMLVLVLVLGLSGCHVLPPVSPKTRSAPVNLLCPFHTENTLSTDTCDLQAWLEYWVEVNQLDWKTRKKRIANLSPNTNNIDRLKVILLSQAPDTPYQSRLRAQKYSEDMVENDTYQLGRFIQFIVFLPAQRALELESAVTTLSRINSAKDQQLKEQQSTIDAQRMQLEKILQIEKSMIEQPAKAKP